MCIYLDRVTACKSIKCARGLFTHGLNIIPIDLAIDGNPTPQLGTDSAACK